MLEIKFRQGMKSASELWAEAGERAAAWTPAPPPPATSGGSVTATPTPPPTQELRASAAEGRSDFRREAKTDGFVS